MHGKDDRHPFFVGKPEGNLPLGNQGISGRIILKFILKNWRVDWIHVT
jgi:hypothetical protein